MIKIKGCLWKAESHVCTWIQHGLIAAALVGFAGFVIDHLGGSTLAHTVLVVAVALAVTGGFIRRELRGPGDLWGYGEGDKIKDLDRRMDWQVPLAAAAAVAFAWALYWRG